MNATLFFAMYYLGLIACSLIGSLKSNQQHRMATSISILCAFTCSFMGGFLRDCFVLRCPVWLFSADAIPDVVLVVLVSLFIRTKTGRAIRPYNLDEFVFIADSLGLVTFIHIGVDKAILFSSGFLRSIICGYFTACYGGMILHHSFEYFLSPQTLSYHAISIAEAVLYYKTRSDKALFITTLWSLVLRRFVFMELDYSRIVLSRMCSLIKSFLEAMREKYPRLKAILQLGSGPFQRVRVIIRRPIFFSSRLRYC